MKKKARAFVIRFREWRKKPGLLVSCGFAWSFRVSAIGPRATSLREVKKTGWRIDEVGRGDRRFFVRLSVVTLMIITIFVADKR
ncbi:MAG: hypothetical protein LBN29_10455 [Mediterranea sp.]|jgi:hypothetical protein|nr:hypothetical protein [Mediterranea sp.]